MNFAIASLKVYKHTNKTNKKEENFITRAWTIALKKTKCKAQKSNRSKATPALPFLYSTKNLVILKRVFFAYNLLLLVLYLYTEQQGRVRQYFLEMVCSYLLQFTLQIRLSIFLMVSLCENQTKQFKLQKMYYYFSVKKLSRMSICLQCSSLLVTKLW